MTEGDESRRKAGEDPTASEAALPAAPAADADPAAHAPSRRPFIGPRKHARFRVESVFVRLVATCGVVGINVALAAILGSQNVSAWIIGLVVSAASVVMSAILWSSREL